MMTLFLDVHMFSTHVHRNQRTCRTCCTGVTALGGAGGLKVQFAATEGRISQQIEEL